MYTADRRIDVEWDRGADQGGYTVDLTLAVEDRKGLLAEISAKIADVNTNITNIEAKTQDGHLGRMAMTLEIRDLKHLEKVLQVDPQGAGRAGGGEGVGQEIASATASGQWRVATGRSRVTALATSHDAAGR